MGNKLREDKKIFYRKISYTKSFFVGMLVAPVLMLAWIQALALNPTVAVTNSQKNTFTSILPDRQIEGIVTDESGQPLVGVTIRVQGNNQGSVTDAKGHFSMTIPDNAVLEISYVGYESQTVTVAGKETLHIILVPISSSLDEVVVVGYGTQKKRDLTGSITTVKSSDIVLNPSSNPMAALQGRVPGMDITKSSGKAGSGVSMQLNGIRSISASGAPLVLINGMPGSYSTLNPNDIASIDILKDAASTAIYGAAGSNGVILITTKKGTEGQTKISFNSYVGFNGWSKTPIVHNGQEFFKIRKQAQQIAGTYTTDENVLPTSQAYDAYKRGETIDWMNAIMSNNLTQNYSLSFSTGTEKTNVYFSLNYSNEKGQYKGNDYKVYSTNFRIKQELNDWLSVGVNGQMAYANANSPYSKMEHVLRASPYGSLYDSLGRLNPYPVAGDKETANFLLDANQDLYRDEDQNYDMYLNPYVLFTPLKGLTFESRLGIHLAYHRTNSFIGIGSYQYYNANGAGTTGTNPTVSASISQNPSKSYRWENILTYKFDIASRHNFKFTGVTTYTSGENESTYMYNNQFTSNSYLWDNLGIGLNPTVGSGYTMSKRFGLIGRLNYSYKGKYLLEASVREDGSSQLAEGLKWSTFPAASIGWRISDESFMQGTEKWLSNLKLRAGYGVTGTASIDPYSSVANIESGFYSLSGEKVIKDNYSQLLPNPDLTWEKSYNANIGVDAGFFNYRIKLSADYYVTHTDGVIWTKNIPAVNGAYNASTPYQTRINIAKTKNRGFDLSLNTRNIVNRDFTWNSTVTFSTVKGEITKLSGKAGNAVINGDYALMVGSPLRSYYSYKVLGIWQNNEKAEAAVFGEKPGDIKIDVPNLVSVGKNEYIKLNSQGDPVVDDEGNKIIYSAQNPYAISENDRQIIGHNAPDWWLGFQNSFAYKGFDLTVYFYMRYGQMINYSLLTDYDPTGTRNFPKYFDYWTPTNPSNDFPGLNASNPHQNYLGFSSLSYVDGSFFKLKNITLGYTLPATLMEKAGIEKLRFYGTVTNLFVVAKSDLIKNYDPEQNGDLNFPLTKQVVLGVNLTF